MSANPDFDMFRTSEDHEAIREAVRAVAEAKIKPFAAEVDEESRFPSEANQALIASDFHAAHVAEEHGGVGADALAVCIIIEEVARVCASSSRMRIWSFSTLSPSRTAISLMVAPAPDNSGRSTHSASTTLSATVIRKG